ncbi:hypothetical protein BGZ83_005845 [Gryganskiella cystojenkinii]|nr:hypothetical protein BGZ83_005845 [Gryganskiella cystojenkinii]
MSRSFDILHLIFQKLKESQTNDEELNGEEIYCGPPRSTSHSSLFSSSSSITLMSDSQQQQSQSYKKARNPFESRTIFDRKGPHSTPTSVAVTTMAQNRAHDHVQDAFSKICQVNRAFAKVGLPFLWENPRIRTSRQLDRFAYTLEQRGFKYYDYLHAVVIRQGSIPVANHESLWWGHARVRAILFKIAAHCGDRLRLIDCNWAGSAFDHKLIKTLSESSTVFIALKSLRLEPLQMPSKERSLNEDDFNTLMTCCPNLESLELEEGYEVSDRSMIHLLMVCENLLHLTFPSCGLFGWVDAIEMGFGDSLRSIKIYDRAYASYLLSSSSSASLYSSSSSSSSSISARTPPLPYEYPAMDDYSFRAASLPNLESLNLETTGPKFIRAILTKPRLPALKSLRIPHASNEILSILARGLATQLTFFETKLDETVDLETFQFFSNNMASPAAAQTLDCSPGPVLGLIGPTITTLSANSSLRLLDTIAESCPNLEDLTLWGGSVSRRPPSNRGTMTRAADPQSGMIYLIEMCPIKRLRLVNAYLGLGPLFWQACGEFGKQLRILDIELLDCKGMNAWGMFEGLSHCKNLRWLRLTELLGVQKEVMMACLTTLKHLCALHLSIPDRETGRFAMTMDEIAAFLACFQDLSEVNLILPKPWPNSASTTPRTSMDLSERKKEQQMQQRCRQYGYYFTKTEPTMVFKNVFGQNIYGSIEWSPPMFLNY